MPVISRRYSTTSGASLPPTGNYRTSTLDRSYCSSNSYTTPTRMLTHSRVSTFDSYRYDETPKKTISYQKYSKDSIDTSRFRRSESRNRDSIGNSTDSGTLSGNEALYNRMMATSAADIINKYSPANYVPKELVRSRSLSDPRNTKEKSQVICSVCQTKITPQFNALNIPCNNTKCISNINKTNHSMSVLPCSLMPNNKFNSFDLVNSGTKCKPIYRTIPEPNRKSVHSSNHVKKGHIEKLHTVSAKNEVVQSNKTRKVIGAKRRLSNIVDDKIESCPDIRQWSNKVESNTITTRISSQENKHSKVYNKTKDVTDKFDTSINNSSNSIQLDNNLKRNIRNIKLHNNVDSDNNGNNLVAEIRKKFGHQQNKNSSNVVWSNLGKTRKLSKSSTDKGHCGNSNAKKSVKSAFVEKRIECKEIGEKSTNSLKRSYKKEQGTSLCDTSAKTESETLEHQLTYKFDEALDKCNKNYKAKCMSNFVNVSDSVSSSNADNIKKDDHHKDEETQQTPVTENKNFSNVSDGEPSVQKFDKEKQSDLRTNLDDSNKGTLVVNGTDKNETEIKDTEKPSHIRINTIQDSYVNCELFKRSPTNHTSDIPSYIPINQPINSSIFEEYKVEDIKFIDSELDNICDDDLNSNLRKLEEFKLNSTGNCCADGTGANTSDMVEMNNYDHVVSKSGNINHKNSTQGTIKRIAVDNSVPSTSRRAFQSEQSYIAEPTRDRISTIRSTLPVTISTRASSIEQDTNKNAAGLNGLRNIGNTCFMNSVLQCLSNTRLLTEYLKKESSSGEFGSGGALIKAFSALVSELWAPGNSRVVNTSLLKSQVQKIAPRFMGYAQQDAQEFLRYLLEGLHEDINRVKNKPRGITTEIDDNLSDNQKSAEAWARYIRCEDSHIVDLFVGQLKSTLRCTICGHSSVTFDPFWDLSLPIPSRVGQLRLNQCLDLFTKEEILDGDEKPTCSKCQVRRKCTKRFSIQKFPKILVIHLKRFSPTERFRGKLNSLIDFPLTELDLSSYAANSGIPCIYDLYAVSNHSGTTYSGHYTAYCKHPYTHDWHEYNDSRVSNISSRSIVSNEAYVLFYELSNHQSSHL